MFWIARLRYHSAFRKSVSTSALTFLPARLMYFTALPRQKSRPHASMTLIASKGLSAPP
jgi:hypothetical protein